MSFGLDLLALSKVGLETLALIAGAAEHGAGGLGIVICGDGGWFRQRWKGLVE